VKPSRRDPVRELQQLLRVPEEGAANIGAFLFDHAEALASALGSSPEDLRASEGMPDEVVAPRLRARLGRRREVDRERQALEDTELAMRAATVLGRTARWTEHGAVLDTDLLLGDVLADRQRKYIAFNGEAFTVAIERDILARAEYIQKIGGPNRRADQMPCVDLRNFHLRRQSFESILHNPPHHSRNERGHDVLRRRHHKVTFHCA